jgi:diguanylate cyclase (GGDEF)-like protein
MKTDIQSEHPEKTRALSEERPTSWRRGPIQRSMVGLWTTMSAVLLSGTLMIEVDPHAILWTWGTASLIILFLGLGARVRDLEGFITERQVDHDAHHARLREAALTDPLTGLPNRRHLMERLHQEVARSNRSGEALACLFLDVDGFADINNKYLHEAGDAILSSLGGVLRRQLRTSDVVARYGGDEFVILLSRTDPSQVAGVADRLRRAVGRQRFRALPTHEAVTVSVGAALCGLGHQVAPNDLLRAADEALYQAKERGRDRVGLHESLAGHAPSGTVRRNDLENRNQSIGGARASSRRVARSG